ncbi:MAG: hypothetical protein Q8R67_26205 [Rhodoferax sp.]|nr:hypothetical protein [Rhodoferax sp.]MDP3655167.1 hypothetical protein [Rhodoferax sp.]
MEFKSLGLGAIFGTIAWEIGKQIFSHFFKRHSDAADAKRKMLRDDIEGVAKLACDLNETATSYYALPYDSDKAQELSRQIKAKIKTAGMKLHAVSVQLSELNKPKIEVHYWTAYKQAATAHLDVKRSGVWPDDDSRLREIHRCAHYFHISLNTARYACA